MVCEKVRAELSKSYVEMIVNWSSYNFPNLSRHLIQTLRGSLPHEILEIVVWRQIVAGSATSGFWVEANNEQVDVMLLLLHGRDSSFLACALRAQALSSLSGIEASYMKIGGETLIGEPHGSNPLANQYQFLSHGIP